MTWECRAEAAGREVPRGPALQSLPACFSGLALDVTSAVPRPQRRRGRGGEQPRGQGQAWEAGHMPTCAHLHTKAEPAQEGPVLQ